MVPIDSLESALKDLREQFLRDVHAKHIASDACHKEIISEEHETRIDEAKSVKDANMILFKHLLQQGTQSSLEELCDIMIRAKGYRKMNEFGQTLRTKVSITDDSSCMCEKLATSVQLLQH